MCGYQRGDAESKEYRVANSSVLQSPQPYCTASPIQTGQDRRQPVYKLLPPTTTTSPAVAVMGQQHSSKVHKSGSKSSTSSLHRVSRLFQPGLKGQRGSGSNSSPQPSRVEDATANSSAKDGPEPESRPAERVGDQV